MAKTLKTDRVFLALSIPMPPQQETELQKSLMREGCKEPVIVWDGVIIDGHKRYEFCIDEGIEFSTEELSFPSVLEAISWVCKKRIPDFDKMSSAYRYLVGKLYNAQKQIYHEEKKLPEDERKVRLDPDWDRVSYLVAEELNLHRATVESHGMYAVSMDQIAEKSWQLFRAILSGSIRLTFKETQACAVMSERKLKDHCKTKWGITDNRDKSEMIRNRTQRQGQGQVEHLPEIPLSVGIKEMPPYDPDMELNGLTLTIPAWITAISRVEKKTDQATDQAKEQLAKSLIHLREQVDKLLGGMSYDR